MGSRPKTSRTVSVSPEHVFSAVGVRLLRVRPFETRVLHNAAVLLPATRASLLLAKLVRSKVLCRTLELVDGMVSDVADGLLVTVAVALVVKFTLATRERESNEVIVPSPALRRTKQFFGPSSDVLGDVPAINAKLRGPCRAVPLFGRGIRCLKGRWRPCSG